MSGGEEDDGDTEKGKQYADLVDAYRLSFGHSGGDGGSRGEGGEGDKYNKRDPVSGGDRSTGGGGCSSNGRSGGRGGAGGGKWAREPESIMSLQVKAGRRVLGFG